MTLNGTIIEKLEKEYEETLNDVASATNEETRNSALRELEQLHKQLMDYKKFEFDHEQKALDRIARRDEVKAEQDAKEAELNENKKNRIGTWVMTGATSLLTLGSMFLTNKWLKTTMAFEETGTFTSKSGSFVQGVKRLFGNKG